MSVTIWTKPGELRQVIDIEAPLGAQSASGAWSNQPWTKFATGLRARFEPTGGSEQFGSADINARAAFNINIRYYPGILPKMRVNLGGRLFDILNVNNILERNREIQLTCREGRSHGNQ